MSVLVDTSVWVEYFRKGNDFGKVEFLIDENIIVINELILTELIPFLKLQNHLKLINLLKNINKIRITINWDNLVEIQYKCLKKGINGVGIPDLIISQNAIQNNCKIYSLDKHFHEMSKFLDFDIF
ncbi:MAG: PIN domain-containing protein [Desulfobacterales bacterium]